MPDWLDKDLWAELLTLTQNEPLQGPVGHTLQDMFECAGLPLPNDLHPGRIDRAQVQDFCSRNAEGNRDKDCFLVIVAWGGMNRKHARSALAAWEQWHQAFSQVREAPNRHKAYLAFSQLRELNENRQRALPCVGPAYYTKLITFLVPRLRPYIMDQWTAKAVEVLSDDGFRLVWTTRRVTRNGNQLSDQNTPATYEKFCQRMDQLAGLQHNVALGEITPELASAFEARLFSRGGRGRAPAAPWRERVKAIWNQTHGGTHDCRRR